MVTLLLAATLILGFVFTGYKTAPSARLDVLAVSIITGSVLVSWLSFVWVAFFGYDTLGLLLSLIVTISSIQLVRKHKLSWNAVSSWLNETRMQLHRSMPIQRLLLLVALLLFFTPLFQTHYFQEKQGAFFSAGNAWGDLALHATQTNWFAYQESLDLTNPIFAHQNTTYPFLVNFFAALFQRGGASFQVGFWLSAVPLVIATFFLIYSVTARYFRSHTAGLVAVFLVCTTGSTAGFLYAIDDWLIHTGTLQQFLKTMPDYGHMIDENLHWSNTITDMILPQRSFVMGFSVWLAVAWLFVTQLQKNTAVTLAKISLLIGLLPFIHVHSFAILFGLLLWLGSWAVWKQQLSLRQFLISCGAVLILAAPQLWWQFGHTHSDSFMSFTFGWYSETASSVGIFWLRHWGVYLLLLFAYPLVSYWLPKLRPTLPAWGALSVLFLMNNVIQFQPHLYDNSKFLEAVQVFLCCVLAYILVELWKRRLVFLVIAICIVTSSSGILGLVREFQLSYQFISLEERILARELTQVTSTEDLFVTAPLHNHPAMMMAGRKSLLGFPGWLWTHGIDSSAEHHILAQVYAGSEAAESFITTNDIKYVYFSRLERDYFEVLDEQYYADRYPIVAYSTGVMGVRVYQVRE